MRDHGDYDLVLFDVETLPQRNDAFRSFARTDRVDGLLVMSLRPSDEEVDSLRREGLPVVLVDVRHPALPRVVIDDVLGGEMATEHLLDKGHTRIGFVGDAPTPFGFTSSEHRRQGMARALRRAGLKRRDDYEYARPARPRGGARARRAAAAIDRAADGDLRGLGRAGDGRARAAARSSDCAYPQDLAVIGFDDIDVAEVLGLTTVHQPLRETGARGVELLLTAIDGIGGEPTEELAPLTVIARRTT